MIKKVKVGGLNFKVKLNNRMETENGTWVVGQANYAKQLIEIAPKQSKGTKRVTLIHEIIHLIFDRAGMHDALDSHTQEQLCNVFAYAFLDLVRDNPKLIKYLRA